MSKEEFIKKYHTDDIEHDKWLLKHEAYLNECMDEIRPYFDCDSFVKDHTHIANELVIKKVLAEADNDNNFEYGEFEDYIATFLCIPLSEMTKYRTEKFWKEIESVEDDG